MKISKKRFRILTNFVGEPPHIEAQPPHAVAEPNSNLHFIFLYLSIYFYIFIYLFIIFIIIIIVFIFFFFLSLAGRRQTTISSLTGSLASTANSTFRQLQPVLQFVPQKASIKPRVPILFCFLREAPASLFLTNIITTQTPAINFHSSLTSP
jgi:cellulose synthase/poly-beta-1,6-N-acetylglucosamine synthase-like glycosyltransferase